MKISNSIQRDLAMLAVRSCHDDVDGEMLRETVKRISNGLQDLLEDYTSLLNDSLDVRNRLADFSIRYNPKDQTKKTINDCWYILKTACDKIINVEEKNEYLHRRY